MHDLEIYVKELAHDPIRHWLGESLEDLQLEQKGSKGVITGVGFYCDHKVRVSLYPGAFNKHFTCVVLEGEELPWRSDLDCARNAWRHLDTEIRCSPGNWKEGDPVEDEKWWRIDSRGEQKVVWN
ncbi:hypothetical protein RE428_18120 [Marinobacter nanhaiticus D15-8W]|uniref:Uncharacterized protein n=1 Tax=Marinobacter nanhaiticus D15-8W TaxID=626887 RepID=N6WX74_9GAMM|nr:hypothetical protein [Marinobacter nanhaiticus]ENO13428.1 hypothetical protein J057_18570 [Marinobacter nanhaiticus D15-8W]BES70794.1 hypothetical protein RE428_18120 [Marinobacter nanhaiticus D15-8W]